MWPDPSPHPLPAKRRERGRSYLRPRLYSLRTLRYSLCLMTDPIDKLFADMLHLGAQQRKAGDPGAQGIVPASVYHLPGDPAGPYQYGRWSNPTWTALEDALGALEAAESVLFPSGMAAC